MTLWNKFKAALKPKPIFIDAPPKVLIQPRKWVITTEGVGIITEIMDVDKIKIDLTDPESSQGETLKTVILDANFVRIAAMEDIPASRRPSKETCERLGYFSRGAQ
jgi:hypothetical protein